MVPQWKRWLGAAAVLLLAGAGCQATTPQDYSQDFSGESEDDGQMKIDAATGLEAEADAAIDAALGESEGDADVVNNDSAELNAYGQTYVESEIR